MATVSSPRAVSAGQVSQQDDFPDICLHIPKNVNTLAGFRKWVLADDFPEEIRVTFLQGEIYLELNEVVLEIPKKINRLSVFRKWILSPNLPEKLRATFLQGEVYLDMTKENLDTHAEVKWEVYRVVGQLNHELDLGKFYADGVLIVNVAADVSNNPDGVGILWESLESGRVRLVEREGKRLEIEGSPDWGLEIVSDSSVGKDTRQLRQAYHPAKLKEYWLIDARGEEISFQILHWRKKGYVAAPNKEGWQRSKVFGREFRLVREFGRGGTWKYTLLVRE
jgi:Uma2 family endonuclease